MPHYHTLGRVPHKRHTQFRKPDGSLYAEQVFSTEGFSADYSLRYHVHPPTGIIKTGTPIDVQPQLATEKALRHRSFEGFRIRPETDFLKSRVPILVNKDVQLSLSAPQEGQKAYFFENADADELIFVHEGSGVLKTMYGDLPFAYGDYLCIPRGTIYQMHFEGRANRLLLSNRSARCAFPKGI